jgi:hypothetical protein
MDKIFELNADPYHSGDSEYDAFLEKPLNDSNFYMSNIRFIAGDKVEFPNILYFRANMRVIKVYDFPYNNVNVLIISDKMLNVLLEVELFPFQKIPIVMIDDLYLSSPFDIKGELVDEVITDESFSCIQLEPLVEMLDYEKSEFISMKGREKKSLTWTVFKEKINGFPPVFRIEENPFKVFVSNNAKESLEANGIKGCIFVPVEVTPYLQS